jgi:polyferredoxin
MDTSNTVSIVEVLALGINMIGLIVLFRLKDVTDLQSVIVEDSNKKPSEKRLLKLAVSRHRRSIYNRGVMHFILGFFNVWMMFRQNIDSLYVISFNVGLLIIVLISTVISLLDIRCEREMAELIENESV